MMQRERSDVYIIPPNFAKEGTLFSGRIEGRNAFEAAVLFIVLFRTISGNPRQFNYRDESVELCISAHGNNIIIP